MIYINYYKVESQTKEKYFIKYKLYNFTCKSRKYYFSQKQKG